MRPFVLFLTLLIAACTHSRERRCEAVLEGVKTLREKNGLAAVRSEIEKALLEEWPETCRWKLRLALADTLLTQRQIAPAQQALGEASPASNLPVEVIYRYSLLRGYSLLLAGKLDASRPLLEEARRIAAASKKPGWEADALLRLANADLLSGKLDAAESGFRAALAKASAVKDEPLQANITGSLGMLFYRQDRLSDAVRFLEQSLALARKTGSGVTESRTRGNLAIIYFRLGDPLRAADSLRIAEQVARENGMIADRVRWRLNLANVQTYLRNFAAARGYYEQGLEEAVTSKDEDGQARFLLNLAAVSLEEGNVDEGIAYNERSIEIRRRLHQDLDPNELAAAQLARAGNRFESARDRLRTLLAKKALPFTLRWEGEAEMARALAGLKDTKGAGQHYQEAFRLWRQAKSELRETDSIQFGFFLAGFSRDYVRFLVRENQWEQALAVTDQIRTPGRNENSAPVTFRQLRSVAKRENAVIVSYWLDPKESLAWVISGNRKAFERLPGEQVIQDWVEQAEEQTFSGDRKPGPGEATQRLYAALIEKTLQPAERKGRVWIAADGPLLRWNFEALATPEPSAHFWIEDATITRVASLASLAGRPPQSAGGARMLVIGDPLSPAPEFPRLPQASAEINEVAGVMPETVVRREAAATREAYLESNPAQYDYIHFAAHAVANSREPLQSALILSPSTKGYRLAASEIAATPLKARLVTLASCRSAGAATSAGLAGLGWAFLRAGAHSVIASLRDVDDGAARELSSRLYKEMRSGKPPADALRAAKLAMLAGKKYREPVYWAPWILME